MTSTSARLAYPPHVGEIECDAPTRIDHGHRRWRVCPGRVCDQLLEALG